MEVVIRRSPRPDKKMEAVIDGKKTVLFGQKNASDYTLNKDDERKRNYIRRHQSREDWGLKGIDTPGFYAKNVLWNKRTVQASVADLNRRFPKVHFVFR